MNNHFTDARYYARQTAHHVRLGLTETLGPASRRARRIIGRQPEPEPEPEPATRLEAALERVDTRTNGRVRTGLNGARSRVDRVRSRRSSQ